MKYSIIIPYIMLFTCTPALCQRVYTVDSFQNIERASLVVGVLYKRLCKVIRMKINSFSVCDEGIYMPDASPVNWWYQGIIFDHVYMLLSFDKYLVPFKLIAWCQCGWNKDNDEKSKQIRIETVKKECYFND